MSQKLRLDVTLVQRGLATSRQRAAAMIRAGTVQVLGKVADKPSMLVDADTPIEAADPLPYVGRGGLKLEAGLDAFGLDVSGWVCMDVGASTGGFTDCLLQRGARHVYAVDVGRDQLAQGLKEDPRVTSLEQTDIRALEPSQLGHPVDLAVCDVSFISLRLVLPSLYRLLDGDGQAVVLIKPQFEVGRAHVGKGGIVKDAKARQQAVDDVLETAKAIGFIAVETCESPILGGDGNAEYLALLQKKA